MQSLEPVRENARTTLFVEATQSRSLIKKLGVLHEKTIANGLDPLAVIVGEDFLYERKIADVESSGGKFFYFAPVQKGVNTSRPVILKRLEILFQGNKQGKLSPQEFQKDIDRLVREASADLESFCQSGMDNAIDTRNFLAAVSFLAENSG